MRKPITLPIPTRRDPVYVLCCLCGVPRDVYSIVLACHWCEHDVRKAHKVEVILIAYDAFLEGRVRDSNRILAESVPNGIFRDNVFMTWRLMHGLPPLTA